MVLKPDSEFFRYFVDPAGRQPTASRPGAAPGPGGTAGTAPAR
jgi:hypothetical protein